MIKTFDVTDTMKEKDVWKDVSCQGLTEDFIEKFSDKVEWNKISKHQELSEEFIERHHDKIDWKELSSSQDLSDEFVEKHKDKL